MQFPPGHLPPDSSRKSRSKQPADPPEEQADWLAWGLQFVFGAGVGAVGGWMIVMRVMPRHSFSSLPLPTFGWILGGISLLCAGLASLHGDRLWFGDNYRMIMPDGVRQSRLSRTLSHITCFLGAAVLVRAYLLVVFDI